MISRASPTQRSPDDVPRNIVPQPHPKARPLAAALRALERRDPLIDRDSGIPLGHVYGIDQNRVPAGTGDIPLVAKVFTDSADVGRFLGHLGIVACPIGG